jgi:hypothetical protein
MISQLNFYGAIGIIYDDKSRDKETRLTENDAIVRPEAIHQVKLKYLL